MDDSLERCVRSLEENAKNVRDEARRTLLNICRNVLESPNNHRFRELRLNDEIVIEKLLPAIGAMECLFDVGFVEDGERIFLPRNASLLRLQSLSRLLYTAMENSLIIDDVDKVSAKQKKFFSRIIRHYRYIMYNEDPDLQRKARRVIPIAELEIATMKKMRDLQKSVKLGDAAAAQFEEELIAKDLFLVELLHWFKYEFFKWVNYSICPTCSIECSYENAIPSTDPYCMRIELHRCPKCNIVVEFPRYAHPEPLLTLRRGRCGEWATVFTFLCRSLGYDARFIRDETDHTWTEIWSASNKRWVHMDPCENVIDKPLMYEKGWQKKLTYIIAFSKDEVQDVTWRYTRNQEAVLKRRKICTEQSLINFLQSLNDHLQTSAGYSRARREYVTKRKVLELADMLYIPNAQNKDSDDETYEGRTSGSLTWRLARGEIAQADTENSYVWDISKYGQTFELRYNVVKDLYYVVRDDEILEQKSGWLEGINATEGGIFRKMENDWKVVYLARSQQAKRGRVKWAFEIANSESRLEAFTLKAKSEVFQGAQVCWEIEATFDDGKVIVMPIPNCEDFHTEDVREAVRLNVIATLSGGQGQSAWQHAQLFRQSLDNTEKPSMKINIQLKKREV